jgi:hypothetical protein
MCQRKAAFFLKLNYQTGYSRNFFIAERSIFSTVNFCLITLNVRASCSKLMTSLHNASARLHALAALRFAMLMVLGVQLASSCVSFHSALDHKHKHPGKV